MGDCSLLHPPMPIDTAAAMLLAGLLAITLWVAFKSRFHGKPFFVVSLIGAMLWLGAVMMEHRAIGEACKILWAQRAWAGIALLPIALCFFIEDYARARDRWPSPRKRAALVGGPLAIWAMAATNDWHGGFYGPQTGLDPLLPGGQVVYDHGPLFHLAAGWLYLFVIAGVVVLLRGLYRAHPAHRPFFLAWLLVLVMPIGANLGYIFGRATLSGMDPTAYAYALAMMIFSWFIITDRMLDLRAVATEVLFRNAPSPILIVTPDGTVAAANPAALSLCRQHRAGGPLADWPVLGAHADALLDPAPAPLQIFRLSGRSYELRIIPMEKPLDSRAEMGRLLFFNDVTEREALEAKLAAERDYLNFLMQTTMTGIVALDGDGQVIFANAEAGKLARMDPEAMIGRHHGALFPPMEVRTEGVACFESVIRTPARQRGLQVGIHRADGVDRMLSVNVARIDRPGVEARVVCALADVTEELETARSLDAARSRAEAANRTKSQFLANMSHEIRTPLNGVLGMAEVLEDALSDPQTRAMARTIRDSGATLLSLLNDLLDMSKIEAGKMEIEVVPFDPAQIVKRIAALHAIVAREKGLDFDARGPAPGSSPRLGDAHRILQVIHNLVSNAIKFTETGIVRLHLDAMPGAPLVIEVRDTGIGMTPDQAARVFAEFEQGDGSVARRFGGTGLGMAITRSLVEQMGGAIALESAPGRGTCVRVTLPLEDAAPQASAPTVPPVAGLAPRPLAGLSLLAADDNGTNRKVLTLMLERAGARVHAVEGGQAALAAWRPEAFDLVLLDISMPDMDGISTLAALRDKARAVGAPQPAALAITANVMTHQIAEYRAAGFVGHAGKPFQSATLIAEILRAVEPGQSGNGLSVGRAREQAAG